MVVAATNHPERIDPALLRPGRLDTRILIPMPNARDLEGIARFHLRGKLPDADLSGLGVALRGLTGAHVERLVRIARRRARKLDRELLLEDLFAALGEKLADLPREYLERIAIHEAGHAIAAVVLKISHNVGISLFHLAGGSASTYFDPQIEAVTRKVVERRIEVALAGRAAEQVLLGEVTAGAGGSDTSDLAMATNLAFSAVARWGLSDMDRPRWFGCGPEQIVATHPELADEAYAMLDVANKRALALIRRRTAQVWAVAGALLKRPRWLTTTSWRCWGAWLTGRRALLGSRVAPQGAAGPTAAHERSATGAGRHLRQRQPPYLILRPAVEMTLPQRSVSLLT